MEEKQLLEAWDIHNRVNLYLLEAIDAEHLEDVSASKGRSVGEQFAHVHNVRLMWLKQAAPELIGKLKKIEKDDAIDKRLLYDSLIYSRRAMDMLLAKGIESNAPASIDGDRERHPLLADGITRKAILPRVVWRSRTTGQPA